MLPFVYTRNEDGGDTFDTEQQSQKRSRSRTRSSSRSPSPPTDRRCRRSRWSCGSSSSAREDGERTRSPSLTSERSSCRSNDRRSSIESGEFSSGLPYRSSLQCRTSRDDVHLSAPYGEPHYKIVLTMLPQDLERDTLIAQISRQGFRVKDVRVIHRSPDRCFCFVEFQDVNNAQAWMEFNKGVFVLDDGRKIGMEYCRYDTLDGRRFASSSSFGDWMCAKCTIKNFKNRSSCFKCNITKMESEGLARKGYAAVGVAKCDTLLLRELPLKCTETAIQTQFKLVTSVEPLRVHVAESGLYAYVQMHDADEAERALFFLNHIHLHIDGCAVLVTYSRLPLNTVLSTSLAAESLQNVSDRVNQMLAFKSAAGAAGNSGVEAAQLAIAKAALVRQMTESIASGNVYTVPPPTIVPARSPVDPNFMNTDYFKGEQSSANFVYVEDLALQPTQEFANPSMTSSGCLPSSVAVVCTPGAPDLGIVETPWGVFRKYAAPDPALYQYEPSSGLYFDPATGLYYDNNSQYYWDSNMQKWNCWNPSFQAYIPCDLLSADKNLPSQAKEIGNSANEWTVKEGAEEVKEKESSPVADSSKKSEKSAKNIVREMARWAKKQNKVLLSVKTTPKHELATPLTTASSEAKASEESTADIIYKMLDKTRNPLGTESDSEDDEEPPPPRKIAAAGIGRLPLNATLPAIRFNNDVQEAARSPPVLPPSTPSSAAALGEEKFVDAERKFCILCKRKFGSLDVLTKHVHLSDMHKKNLEALAFQNDRASTSSPPRFSETRLTSDKPRQYRDRAKERRTMFGVDPIAFTIEGGETDPTDYAIRSEDIPLDETNVGNKLLKSMGWTEGTGIGKNNQGRVTPIATERRVEGAGLGSAGSRLLHSANASRRERARLSAITRYQELS